MTYALAFYREKDKEPVQEFLERLRKGNKQERGLFQKLMARLQLLKEEGLSLPFPYRSHVKGDIHELRARFGNLRGRILFGCSGRNIFLLNGIVKDTQRLEEKEIRLAEERWKRCR